MARIAGVADGAGGPWVRFAYWFSRRRVGRVPEPARIAAHHPGVLRSMGAFEMGLDRARRVDVRLKTLAQIKTAALVGCVF